MTFLDELREEAEHVRANSSIVLPIPASRFVVRFRPPEGDDARDRLTGVVAVYRQGGALSREQELQLLIDCQGEVLRANPDLPNPTVDPLPVDDGEPLLFDGGDDRWGDGVKTARDAVAELYKLTDRPLAAAGTADALIDWLQGLDDEALGRAEGKSGSTRASSETPPVST